MVHPVDGLTAAFAYNAARRSGYNEGYNDGYNECYRKAQQWSQTSYNNGWEEGQRAGYANAQRDGNKIIDECNNTIDRKNAEIARLKLMLLRLGVKA